MIGGEIVQIPVPEPEEHTFLVHMEIMSDLRTELFNDLDAYPSKPDNDSAMKIVASSTELAGHFEEALEFIFSDESYGYIQKVTQVQALHQDEDTKRVVKINEICGQ